MGSGSWHPPGIVGGTHGVQEGFGGGTPIMAGMTGFDGARLLRIQIF